MATALTHLTRRRFGQLALAAGAAAAFPGKPFANVPADTPLHGLSVFGDLKYGPNFTAFDYAAPKAPSGGAMNIAPAYWFFNQSPQTFDTLNTVVLKGNAPPRMESLYDGLMTSSMDEPDSLYCALAQSASVSPDRDVFTFRLRPEARFSTGAQVTAKDVVFSYEQLKEFGHPSLQVSLRNVETVEAAGEASVRIVFNGRQGFGDALVALGMPILSAAFFGGRNITEVSAEVVPGSGRYTVGRYDFGRFIEYEKRPDYWATDLPFARGLGHFQTIRIDFFRDRQPALEAFKKGLITFREEFTTKDWANEYDFPAVRRGAVVKREFPDEKRPTFQCWALNQRRERFADPRVRRAINLCFDFEWTNANLMFGLRQHSDSPFQGSEFVATGTPSPDELALLEPLRGKVPDEVFGEVWVQPVSDGSGRDRKMLREASNLFAEAGWKRSGNRLVDASGAPFALEFLTRGQEQARVYAKMTDTLRQLGVDASIRLVDEAQYQDRLNSFDFDMVLAAFGLLATPTREDMSFFFGSDASDRPGSNNYPGMASEGVDSLIAAVGAVRNRKELVTAMRALDRVLRWRLDWIPNINAPVHFTAFWDMFGFKPDKPDYFWPVEQLWWFDEDKAKAIGKA
ncbi:extracellular solute-binding protein [Aurantimonas sp. VKM B-3413]|uniref:extracellular solute-binding protein n=1 Tax=Aurantimonas sp. VKM B-3413 TaxID=2779401 RepID=UPI001E5D611A|nr:extracellular solute-binding protein [Aurantimonas sp. VKM B-3413]MCB8839703.1 extracellular solute-binding protein [Aurantimonas sp. VKM B-3413]